LASFIRENNKKIGILKGGLMSIAGRIVLINASLSNTSVYHMSMYLLPKTIIDKLDKTRRTFLAWR
jgi:hypothetical protein